MMVSSTLLFTQQKIEAARKRMVADERVVCNEAARQKSRGMLFKSPWRDVGVVTDGAHGIYFFFNVKNPRFLCSSFFSSPLAGRVWEREGPADPSLPMADWSFCSHKFISSY